MVVADGVSLPLNQTRDMTEVTEELGIRPCVLLYLAIRTLWRIPASCQGVKGFDHPVK